MKTRMKAPRPRESEIQRNAITWLRHHGVFVCRRNVITVPIAATATTRRRFVRAGQPGMSDLWGLIPPPGVVRDVFAKDAHIERWRYFDAECKRPGERPTLAQVEWLIGMNRMTGTSFWFESIDMLERVMRCLLAGGRVEYAETTRRYGEAVGPSGDFDVIWPEDQHP